MLYNALGEVLPVLLVCRSKLNLITQLQLWDKHWYVTLIAFYSIVKTNSFKQRPELVHPFAPAIDSPLKEPVEMVCIKSNSKPDYVRSPLRRKDERQVVADTS